MLLKEYQDDHIWHQHFLINCGFKNLNLHILTNTWISVVQALEAKIISFLFIEQFLICGRIFSLASLNRNKNRLPTDENFSMNKAYILLLFLVILFNVIIYKVPKISNKLI